MWALPVALEQNLNPFPPPSASGRHTCQLVMREHVSVTLRSWVSNSQAPRRRGSTWARVDLDLHACPLSLQGCHTGGSFSFLPWCRGAGVQLRGRGGYLGSGA